MTYAVTQHTVTLPGRSLLSKNHTVSRYARRTGSAVPVVMELALPRHFFLKLPISNFMKIRAAGSRNDGCCLRIR